MPNAGIMSIYQPTAGLTREGGKGPFSTLLLPQSLLISVLLYNFRPFLNHLNPLYVNTNWIHMLKDSFSAYNFAILPLFLLDAWGTFNTSMSEGGATRKHQTSSAWVSSQGTCQTCFEEPLLTKNVVQRGGVWQVEGHHQHVGQVSPTAASDVCLEEAHLMLSLPSSPSHSCTSGFWACFPMDQAAPRPTLSSCAKGRRLQPSQHLSGFVLPLECTLNLLSHKPSSSRVHSPLQNKRFEMKVQSCSNNHINYLFRWGKWWVKSSSSDMEELLLSTAKMIFPKGLVFHKVTWPKGVCTHDQAWPKTKQQHSPWHCLMCRTWREERWKQTHDADKNFFLCYSNKKYIHTEI